VIAVDDATTSAALANLRRLFPLICFVHNPFNGPWYAIYGGGGFLVADSALELRERLTGVHRPRTGGTGRGQVGGHD
jgi:hypothetical protein